ncbi:hypothetical protein BJX99DRAFT_231565 [Aspergillus californicus]
MVSQRTPWKLMSFRLAYTEGRELIDIFSSDEQVEDSRGDLYESIDAGDLDPEGVEADMLEILKDYAALIQDQSFRELDDCTRRKALLAFKRVSRQVIREASVIVFTNNNMGDPMAANNFGDTAEALFLIHDEDPKELETIGWVPVAKLRAAPKLNGIVVCGDEKQLRPTVQQVRAAARCVVFRKYSPDGTPESQNTIKNMRVLLLPRPTALQIWASRTTITAGTSE